MSFVALDQGTPAAAAAPLVEGTGTATRVRLDSVDLLRGLVMVVMALDHTRDFFGPAGMNPRDVAEPALFLTRWVTHFCAPVFIFLAGLSAYLYGARGRTTGQVSRFLLTRGFWLVLIEFTLVRFGWTFGSGLDVFVMQVIWVIGASMVVLAGLIHLPRWAILAVGIGMIAGHNLLDSVRAEDLGAAGWVWNVLHQPKLLQFTAQTHVFVLYPLIPWVGVMATGYALGPVFGLKQHVRVSLLAALGAAVTAGFVLIRAANLYGDPAPWSVQPTMLATVLSFVNCEKYPPSLLYLMMTLGPGLVLLAAFEGVRGRVADIVVTFGRVPFFYYVAHLYLIHALAAVYMLAIMGDAAWLFGDGPLRHKPAGYGLGLAGIYAVWLFVVVALYPLCRWFAALKQRRTDWWLSYL
ncbi:MAG TPA: heparan-alpha-glucosaminide N-acetyltransferase domain-containing protein [Xanthobacteraceae bacterium]|nr:heparan-alpha-glucosaminide N-acetyltransferase domain-containing protein [Xanthobacteraceae bacterium]